MSQPSTKDSGFSLVELLVVIFIIAILAALTLPGLLASKRAASEQTTKSKLAGLGAAETTFRTLLAKRRYTSLNELQTTVSGGAPLVSSADITATGWLISDAESATSTTFGLKAVPTTDNPRDLSYAIFEDQVLRTCPRTGPWNRSCQSVDQATGSTQTQPSPTPQGSPTPTPSPGGLLPIGSPCSNDNQCSSFNCNMGVCGPPL